MGLGSARGMHPGGEVLDTSEGGKVAERWSATEELASSEGVGLAEGVLRPRRREGAYAHGASPPPPADHSCLLDVM